MFGLFKRKEPSVPVKDIVFMNHAGKYNYLLTMAREENKPTFVCWFEQTATELQQFFEANGVNNASVLIPREMSGLHGASFIFCEHHPSYKTEQDRFFYWKLSEATVVSSMDDALLKVFGGERIADMMKKMGIKEDEPINHKLINSSVKRAQQKIDRKLTAVVGQSARSQEEWLQKYS